MAEISKQALIVENNTSFPNNNNGQITPSVLRAFNNDMIDSTVNQIVFNNYSASVTESLQSLAQFTASVAGTNAFTASIAGTNAFTQSANNRITDLESWSSSLDVSYASQAEFNSYTSSNDAKVNSLIAFTSSVLSIAALVPLNNFTASVAETNAFTASQQLLNTTFATTGSNLFTGPQILSDDSLNTSTLATISGSLVLVAKTFTSSSSALAHISASSNAFTNLVFKNNNNTITTIVSGSNNIFANPAGVTAGFNRYVGGNSNIYLNILPQITGSAVFPITMANNISNAGVIFRAPVSSSAYTVSSNLLMNGTGTALSFGTSAANNFERAVSGLNSTNNIINGTVNIVAVKTSLSASVGISSNIVGGTVNLNMDSSSIGFLNNTVQGTLTVNNSYFPTTYNATSAQIAVTSVLNSGNNTIYTSGSNTTFTPPPRAIINTSLLGTNNIISASFNGDLAQVHSTHLIGQSLTTFGSNSRPAGATAADWGTTFVGRWNALDGNRARTAETVFVVGTGTAEANRKTGFLIDSGSNTFIEGSLNVSGSTTITGSVTISGSAQSDLTVVGQIFVSSSATGGTTAPRITVSGSAGRTTIQRNSITIADATDEGGMFPSTLYAKDSATFDEIGFTVDASVFGITRWSTGPSIYVNNVVGDTYPAVIGFQNKANYTDGRVTVLSPLVAQSGSIVSGSSSFTGSMNVSGSVIVSGSAYGNVIPLTIASSTASMDCSLGNFFTLTLANSTTTHLTATNIKPGQTINLLVTQGNPSGSISYNSTFDFPSGNAYAASLVNGAKDIVSFISFDSTTLYGTAVKNLV